jgi:predicted dehydrogenase
MHRFGATTDQNFNLVAGNFSTNPEKCRDFGVSIGLAPERCYPDYKTLFAGEANRKDGIEAVTIATPNKTHYEIARAALEAGIHVVCEKPLCFKNEEADELVKLSSQKKLVMGITYGFTGYTIIQRARKMVLQGDLGKIRVINLQYAHGGAALRSEDSSSAFKWRVDPEISGPSFIVADVGVHAVMLAETIVPGLEIEKVLCSKQSFVEGRKLEDNAFAIFQDKNGITGSLWASAINTGCMYGQRIRVVGEKASIEWWDEHPNQLKYEVGGEATRILERAAGYLYPEALDYTRNSSGHPEGLLDSWANLYRRFAIAMDAANQKDHERVKDFWYPDVRAGAHGIKFVSACMKSADNGSVWVEY